MPIIGRKKEQETFREVLQRQEAQFVLLYGRRRVGKTFLVREFFQDAFAFSHVGVSPQGINRNHELSNQLWEFDQSLRRAGCRLNKPSKTWFEAFSSLIDFLSVYPKDTKRIVFIDEMPWLDTPRSNFVSALEHFWNGWAAREQNLVLIVCGSATTWIYDKLITNHGGLYGRITKEIHLAPFTLTESKEYLEREGFRLSLYDKTLIHMVFGGIPYYLSWLKKDESIAQNIDRIFFTGRAQGVREFSLLFSSLFRKPELFMKVVRLLATERQGLTREEIGAKLKIETNGALSKILLALTVSDFLLRYTPINGERKHNRYRLIDPFILFYLRFVENVVQGSASRYWEFNEGTPAIASRLGFAFEDFCFSQVEKIKEILGVAGIYTEIGAMTLKGGKGGAQLDLVLRRKDRIVNLCEIKFTQGEFLVTKSVEENIRKKMTTLSANLKKTEAIHPVLIAPFGVKKNEHASIFHRVITLEDLLD